MGVAGGGERALPRVVAADWLHWAVRSASVGPRQTHSDRRAAPSDPMGHCRLWHQPRERTFVSDDRAGSVHLQPGVSLQTTVHGNCRIQRDGVLPRGLSPRHSTRRAGRGATVGADHRSHFALHVDCCDRLRPAVDLLSARWVRARRSRVHRGVYSTAMIGTGGACGFSRVASAFRRKRAAGIALPAEAGSHQGPSTNDQEPTTKDQERYLVSRLAPGADPPENSLRPSGNVMLTALAVGVPLRAWNASTTRTVPGTRSCLLQPRRYSALAPPVSNAQFTTLPSLPATSR